MLIKRFIAILVLVLGVEAKLQALGLATTKPKPIAVSPVRTTVTTSTPATTSTAVNTSTPATTKNISITLSNAAQQRASALHPSGYYLQVEAYASTDDQWRGNGTQHSWADPKVAFSADIPKTATILIVTVHDVRTPYQDVVAVTRNIADTANQAHTINVDSSGRFTF